MKPTLWMQVSMGNSRKKESISKKSMLPVFPYNTKREKKGRKRSRGKKRTAGCTVSAPALFGSDTDVLEREYLAWPVTREKEPYSLFRWAIQQLTPIPDICFQFRVFVASLVHGFPLCYMKLGTSYHLKATS